MCEKSLTFQSFTLSYSFEENSDLLQFVYCYQGRNLWTTIYTHRVWQARWCATWPWSYGYITNLSFGIRTSRIFFAGHTHFAGNDDNVYTTHDEQCECALIFAVVLASLSLLHTVPKCDWNCPIILVRLNPENTDRWRKFLTISSYMKKNLKLWKMILLSLSIIWEYSISFPILIWWNIIWDFLVLCVLNCLLFLKQVTTFVLLEWTMAVIFKRQREERGRTMYCAALS